MFILEGSDCLGKTTAAKELVRLANGRGDFPVLYKHMTRPPAHFNFSSDYMDIMSVYGVQDRFHLGALAYHDNVMSEECRLWLEGELLSRGSVIVLFLCKNEHWYRDHLHKSKGHMFPTDTLVEANKRYVEMAEGLCPVHCDSIQYINGPDDFPTTTDINYWIDMWFKRLKFLESMMEGD